MSSSDPQDQSPASGSTSSSSYSDPATYSDPTSASDTVSSPEPQQFQPLAPFEPPAPAQPYPQAIDPLTAEPLPSADPGFAAPHTSAPQVYTPQPIAYPQQPYRQQPYNPYAGAAARRPQENGMAIAGLVCSIVGICSCVTVIVGLVLGHIGLAKANRGEAGGRGIALAAVIIAYAVIALYAGFGGTMIILGVNGRLD